MHVRRDRLSATEPVVRYWVFFLGSSLGLT
jgi:hypothetical protein